MNQKQALKILAKYTITPTLKRLAPKANPLDMDGYHTLHFEKASKERVKLLEAWYTLSVPIGVEVESIDEILYKLFDCDVPVILPEPQQMAMEL